LKTTVLDYSINDSLVQSVHLVLCFLKQHSMSTCVPAYVQLHTAQASPYLLVSGMHLAAWRMWSGASTWVAMCNMFRQISIVWINRWWCIGPRNSVSDDTQW